MPILPNIRSYEKYSAVPPDLSGMPRVRGDVTVACMLQPSLLWDMESECNLLPLCQENWEDTLNSGNITFFLAQSPATVSENAIPWQWRLSTLQAVAQRCKVCGIPTVYWDTEGPERWEERKQLAAPFDHILVANPQTLAQYQRDDFKRSFAFLPYGVQLLNCGPVNTAHFGRKDLMPAAADLAFLRETAAANTYTHRLETILAALGREDARMPHPGVTVLTATNKLDSMETIFANYDCQTYEPRELVVILNRNGIDIEPWKERARLSKNATVLRVDEALPLGICLNEGIDHSDFPYVTKFDDDNYYAPEFLTDLMNAFPYAKTEIVGKLSYFCYFESSHILALICPGMENRYVRFLSGSGFIIKREVLDHIRFREKRQGSDSVFLKECIKNGVSMYSTDRFNYVYCRRASKTEHTCKVSDEVLLRSCQFICHTEDYRPIVTV